MAEPKRALPRTVWSARSYWQPTAVSLPVLCIALLVFGIGDGMLVLSQLGSTPWTVLAQGVASKTGVGIGWVSFFISVVVMFTWIPFRQKPGLGTVLNIILIAVGLGCTVQFVPAPQDMVWQVVLMLLGVVLIGVSTVFYLTCYMGPGPRDGLMVGLFQATGLSIGKIRTLLEGIVCFLGWLLGGVVGIGTLVFAFGVGWILQSTLDYVVEKYFVHSKSESLN